MKKNPFKLWGSWIGATLVTVLMSQLSFGPMAQSQGFLGNIGRLFDYPFFLMFFLLIGFLLGWGIEFLIRKNKWFGLK